MDSETPNVGYVLKAFRKLSIESNDVVHLKDEQEKTVDCLLDGRDVLAVMPTGFDIIFQLFATAMTVKKVHEGHHSDTGISGLPSNQHNSGGKFARVGLCCT